MRTFKSVNAQHKLEVIEEWGLLQKHIVIPKLNLDQKECIGTQEFIIIPYSLFASDGSLLLAYDKVKILHHLEMLADTQQHDVHETTSEQFINSNTDGKDLTIHDNDTTPDRDAT